MKGKNLWYLLYFKTFSLPSSSLAETITLDAYVGTGIVVGIMSELLRLDLILYALIAVQRKEHRYKDSQKLDG